MLDIQNLSKTFNPGTVNEKKALSSLSLHLDEGDFVTIVGSNGAGKSTTLKTIAGLVKPKSGSITFQGEPLLGKSTDQIVSRGVTLVPEGRRVFPNLTVEENLRIGAYKSEAKRS